MDSSDKMPQKKIKKASLALDKVLLGVVIGGAVGSILGSKTLRTKIRSGMKDTQKTVSDLMHQTKTSKKSFWHTLHDIFFSKKK
jgi:hypothetical protein